MIDVDLGWCRYFVTDGEFGSVDVGDSTFASRLDNRGITVDQVCWMEQTHSSNILTCSQSGVFGDTDGMITHTPGLLLVTRTADCVPILIFDPVTRTIAALHCGRDGFLRGIIQSGLEKLAGAGCKNSDLCVFLGPHLGVDNHEVGREIVDHVSAELVDSVIVERKGHFYFNQTCGAKLILERLGIARRNIEDCGINTYTDDNYFSYRYMTHHEDMQSKTNRFASCIMLSP
jgi:polyphenol oxidase